MVMVLLRLLLIETIVVRMLLLFDTTVVSIHCYFSVLLFSSFILYNCCLLAFLPVVIVV